MKLSFPLLTITIAASLLVSCGGGKDHDHHNDADSTSHAMKDTTAITVSDTTKFKFDFAIANIPSPASTIQELKAYGAAYDKMQLNDPNKLHGYGSEIQQSINLGVYNIDMVYAMSHNIGSDVLEYTRSVMMLVDRLGLSSSVNSMVGKRAESNMTNRDSIFALIDEIFVKSDSYLRTNKRVYTAANIFTGSWVEAIYLNCIIYPGITDPALREKARKHLWDQRFHLGNLITLLKDFKNEAECMELVKELKTIHDEISAAKQPTDLTEAKFKSIGEKIKNLRTRLTN